MDENGFGIQKISKNSTIDLEAQTVAIAALAGEIWREHFTPIIGAEQVEYMLDRFQSARQIYTDIKENEYTYLTAHEKKSNEMVGYCAVVPKDGFMLLSKCYVRRDYRSNGIARSFINEVVSLCKKQYGFGKIRLTVNKNNIGSIEVYNKLGFERVDSVKTDIGGGFFMDDYIMEYTCET